MPRTMKAAVVRGLGSVALEEAPAPAPNDYQAVAEVLCWATCNSTDYRVVHGNMGWNTPLPLILGHETVGRVVEVGAKVRSYRVGDRLLRVTAVYPGTTMAGYASALGSFTTLGLATDTAAMQSDGLSTEGMVITHFLHQRVPEDMDPADAVMLINLREALSWVNKLDVAGKSVLVIGDGPVGLGFVQAAFVKGAAEVVLVGRREARLDAGRQVGATQTVNGRAVDPLAAVPDLVHGQVDVLVDCTGDQKGLAAALALVKADGKVAAYGSPKIPPTGPMPEDPRIVSIRTDEAGAHDEVLRLVREGRIVPRRFWSDRLRYDQVGEAIRRIGAREAVGKVVLTP